MATAKTKKKKKRSPWPFLLLGLIAVIVFLAWLAWAVFLTVVEPGKKKTGVKSASKPPSEKIMPEEKKQLEEILKKRK
ncbi:MAG: hypothetical protein ACREQK_04750 [Candidatus Binatia bacterium]